MEYISDGTSSKNDEKTLNPIEMLEKLRTHEVVATEPNLIFKPLEEPDVSGYVDGDEEFEFADSEENGGMIMMTNDANENPSRFTMDQPIANVRN
jgi:hypothetical protein